MPINRSCIYYLARQVVLLLISYQRYNTTTGFTPKVNPRYIINTQHRLPQHRRRRPLCATTNDDTILPPKYSRTRSNHYQSRRHFLALSTTATAALPTLPSHATEISPPPTTTGTSSSFATTTTNTSPLSSPYSSTRQYKTITLPNSLRVLLVRDKLAQSCSAAVTIKSAGQFADPPSLPGLAHLMEHMVCAAGTPSDFEEWLDNDDVEGASNAFTAYDLVCYHFALTSGVGFFPEALERFAKLFNEEEVKRVCRESGVLRREVRRVNGELDRTEEGAREKYVLKGLISPDHPFGRFSAGSLTTLEKAPRARGIDVGEKLIEFFHERYLPSRALLVVVAPADLKSIERWVAPFGRALSTRPAPHPSPPRTYPPLFPSGKKQIIRYRSKRSPPFSDGTEKLSMEWELSLDYTPDPSSSTAVVVTATQIAFCLNQILARRGPGSLYNFLKKRRWVAEKKVPRVNIPLDVSGSQILKLEIALSPEGFLNRSSVIAAVYGCVERMRGDGAVPFWISRERVAQFVSIATLHGYILAPRPPDAIELAIDGQVYPLNGPNSLTSPSWHMFPSSTDEDAIYELQKSLATTLLTISDPSNALVIVTAGPKAITNSRTSFIDDPIPPLISPKWENDPVTGARYCYDDMMRLTAKIEQWVLEKLGGEELLRLPVSNPLVPLALRPARRIPLTFLRGFTTVGNNVYDNNWKLYSQYPVTDGILLPGNPQAQNSRCSFTLQLLSSRPSQADEEGAALGEIWRAGFEKSVQDLTEGGAPAGLAYDFSFNKYGVRLSFLGISQNVPSYARRFCRRLAMFHRSWSFSSGNRTTGRQRTTGDSTESPETVLEYGKITALDGINRARNIPLRQKLSASRTISDATVDRVVDEAFRFWDGCYGGVAFGQGDLLPEEIKGLMEDLKRIFKVVVVDDGTEGEIPRIRDISYRTVWKPRGASPCMIAGVPLISDACGRVPR